MAPPTGPRGGATHNRREGSRGARGGGISKRRGTARTDRDGDVSMDAPGGAANRKTGAGGRGNRGGRGARGSTRTSARLVEHVQNYHPQPNRAILKVHGLKNSKAAENADGGLRSLLEFLERKASKDKTVTIGKHTMDGDYVWINVSKNDVPALLRLNGFTHAGATLTITETTERMPSPADKLSRISSAAEETKEKLNSVLASRYTPENKVLDLSSLGIDPVLSSMGTFSSQTTATKAFKALLVLAGARFPNPEAKREAIQAVTLASNSLDDVDQVYSLATTFPDLKRLDLSGNNLESISKLAKWKGRFQKLEEIHLTGNGVANQPNYVADLLEWFPLLHNVNGQQVRSPEQVAAIIDSMMPKPLAQFPSNVRDGGGDVTAAFVQIFFPLFDSDRASLAAQFYDDDSWFSLSAIANSGRPLPWKSYLKYSRNVDRLVEQRNSALVQRLFTGGNLIADMWKTLPATQHPSLDSGLWIIDSHTFPGLADPSGQGTAMGLLINIHGQYEEADSSQNLYGTRTFSRTIILGPSKPHPPPPHPYRVISDQLTLHEWHTRDAVAEQPAPAASPVPVAAPAVSDETLKLQMTEELSKRTGMTLEYSQLCLSGQPNWNFDAALQAFEQQKAALPATAFINGALPV